MLNYKNFLKRTYNYYYIKFIIYNKLYKYFKYYENIKNKVIYNGNLKNSENPFNFFFL